MLELQVSGLASGWGFTEGPELSGAWKGTSQGRVGRPSRLCARLKDRRSKVWEEGRRKLPHGQHIRWHRCGEPPPRAGGGRLPISLRMFHPRKPTAAPSLGGSRAPGPLCEPALQTDMPAQRRGRHKWGPAPRARSAPPEPPHTPLRVVGRASSPDKVTQGPHGGSEPALGGRHHRGQIDGGDAGLGALRVSQWEARWLRVASREGEGTP